MIWGSNSLSSKIFVSTISLVLIASILIAGVTIYQYKEEAKDLHRDKLERKQKAINSNINYVLRTTTYPLETNYIPLIFKEKIYEIQEIHSEEINIFDLEGNLLISSYASFYSDSLEQEVPQRIIQKLENSSNKKHVEDFKFEDQRYQSSYTYITNPFFKPIAILNLPYIEDDGYMDQELRDFFVILSQVYLLMILGAVLLAYFLSKLITKSINKIGEQISETKLTENNTQLSVQNAVHELKPLINAYNKAMVELEESSKKLAQSEREEAWRQMARQVAHEIKNPLTPMRLTVQSFERNFNLGNIKKQADVKDFSQTLIQQIDTLTAIAEAFSNFAKMPSQKSEYLNITKTIQLACDIFKGPHFHVYTDKEDIYAKFDRAQLIRVITNLVKNAQQATENKENPFIIVEVRATKNHVKISVSDNGVGIDEETQKRIFEPKFTTKTSGMGLGLGMVKNIVENFKGNIKLKSKVNKGTTFVIEIPKN